MNVQEKLVFFSKMAMQEAAEKKSDLIKDIGREYDEAIAKVTRQVELHSKEHIRKEKFKIDQLKNKEVMKAATEAKVKLIDLRNRLTDQIFSAVEDKLKQFMQTDAYKDYLLSEIEKQAAGHEDIKITLMPQDMQYQEEIMRRYGIPVEESQEDFIGCFKMYIPKKNGVMDHSFQAMLAEERDMFNLFKIPERGGE